PRGARGRGPGAVALDHELPQLVPGDHRGRDQGHPEEHPGRASTGAAAMINLTITSEQEELVSTVARAASTEFPRKDLVRACVEGTIAPLDDKRWRTVAELGVFSLGVPEAAGGLGLGLADEVLVLVELGRVPARGPWVGTLLATRIAAQAGESDLT